MNKLIENPPTKSPDDKYIWLTWIRTFWKHYDSQFHIYQQASDPTTTDVYVNTWAIYKNTGSGVVKLWVNDAGTLKSVTLT